MLFVLFTIWKCHAAIFVVHVTCRLSSSGAHLLHRNTCWCSLHPPAGVWGSSFLLVLPKAIACIHLLYKWVSVWRLSGLWISESLLQVGAFMSSLTPLVLLLEFEGLVFFLCSPKLLHVYIFLTSRCRYELSGLWISESSLQVGAFMSSLTPLVIEFLNLRYKWVLFMAVGA